MFLCCSIYLFGKRVVVVWPRMYRGWAPIAPLLYGSGQRRHRLWVQAVHFGFRRPWSNDHRPWRKKKENFKQIGLILIQKRNNKFTSTDRRTSIAFSYHDLLFLLYLYNLFLLDYQKQCVHHF